MSANDRDVLMQTSRDWAATVSAGDFERALTYWADDAIVLAPDAPAIVGKAAIREFVRQAASLPGFSITWQPELAVVSQNGDMAYMVEANSTTLHNTAGPLQTHFGKAVTIWRKQPDGAWKCVIDTWNPNPAERVLA